MRGLSRRDLDLIRLLLIVDPRPVPLLKPRRVPLRASRDKDWIPPQGKTRTYGIYPPQGIKGVAPPIPAVPPPPPPPPQDPDPASPNTIATYSSTGLVPQQNLVRVGTGLGGYWYAFFKRVSDHYLCFKSSWGGSSWGSETLASHAALCSAASYDFSVFTDGTYIWIAYPTGVYGGSNSATTIWVRRGTPSAGGISWDNAVQLFQCEGYIGFSFAKTTNYVFLAVRYRLTDATYRHVVYRSADGTSWSVNYGIESIAAQAPVIALSRDPNYTDGLMYIQGLWAQSAYRYKRYDGTTWSASWTAIGEKTASAYVTNNSMSLVTANNEIHFVYLPTNNGGLLRYRYFTTSWSGYTTVDAGTCLGPALCGQSVNLYLYYYYIGGTSVLYRKMIYATHVWDGSASTLASGESSLNYTNCEHYPPIVRMGVVWLSSGVGLRFASL